VAALPAGLERNSSVGHPYEGEQQQLQQQQQQQPPPYLTQYRQLRQWERQQQWQRRQQLVLIVFVALQELP
jgi:hypothetical protein